MLYEWVLGYGLRLRNHTPRGKGPRIDVDKI